MTAGDFFGVFGIGILIGIALGLIIREHIVAQEARERDFDSPHAIAKARQRLEETFRRRK